MKTFDVEAEFTKEAEPLYTKLYALAEKHGISAVFAAVVGVDDREWTVIGMTHSTDAAPPSFTIANAFLQGGMRQGLEAVRFLSEAAEASSAVGTNTNTRN